MVNTDNINLKNDAPVGDSGQRINTSVLVYLHKSLRWDSKIMTVVGAAVIVITLGSMAYLALKKYTDELQMQANELQERVNSITASKNILNEAVKLIKISTLYDSKNINRRTLDAIYKKQTDVENLIANARMAGDRLITRAYKDGEGDLYDFRQDASFYKERALKISDKASEALNFSFQKEREAKMGIFLKANKFKGRQNKPNGVSHLARGKIGLL